MKDITNIAVIDEDGVVAYADGSRKEFQYSGTATTVITSLAATLEKERKMHIVIGDRLRRMYTHDGDMTSRGLNGMSATPMAPTAMNTEFMCLVRAVVPKYDSAPPDADPRIATLDVLHYAFAETFSVVYPIPMLEIQLDWAIDMLEQVGDCMKANNIAPEMISIGDAVRSINAGSAASWDKKH